MFRKFFIRWSIRHLYVIQTSKPRPLRDYIIISNWSFPSFLCSEKPLPLSVLLTDNQGDQSAARQDPQAPPPVTCLVKPLPSTGGLPSDPTSSPATDTRTRSPCSRFGKPLCSARSLPGLSVDSSLEDVAPPPPPGEEWLIPSQAPPTPRPRSQTPSPADSNSRGHVMMVEDSRYTQTKQATPIDCNPASRLAPPPTSCPTMKWSCLNLDQPDVDSPRPAISSGSAPTPPPVNRPTRSCSPPANHVHRAALPVECWADNVNRYYSSQNAVGSGGGASEEEGEELSELETLYQASLKAPSMHRGSRGVSPQPGGSRPGKDHRDTPQEVFLRPEPSLLCIFHRFYRHDVKLSKFILIYETF